MPLVPKIDWTPAKAARIEPNPPRPRIFSESTMSDEDYAKAQEEARQGRACPGVLRDWGEIKLEPKDDPDTNPPRP